MARSFKSTMALPPPDPQYILRGANDAVNTLCFHCRDPEPEFPMLFSGSANGLIHIWNLKTRRVDRTLDGHGGKSVYWVKTFPNRREAILSQGRDQHVCLWDLAEGRNSVTDSLCTGNVGFCKGSLLEVAEGRWLLATAWKNLEEVWVLELPSKLSVCTLKPEADAKLGMPMCLKMWQPSSGSSPLLLVGYEDGSVVLWNLSTGSTLSRLACHQEPIMGLDFDAEKAKGVSGSSEKILCVWSLDEQQNLELQQTHQLTNPGIAETALRPDKKILATAGWDHRIRLFGWKKLKPLAVLDYHTAAIHCVAFSDHAQPSERLLAAGSKDHRISLWSIYSQA
ncbi:guanine nucleotide-binding protein subunit beta-like protein 1 isoform X1 [Varanus komodoensis]|nr:guanine nucleotide-binding protein subunit beta-like protein 1 isoform X1 [Varanus komodoensis]XP_044296831.1 guanine nucleotide-binding protein subunit beta-like protein 1 isoform X1 [Varanus komodoensis]XP_044296832.1 guanine nucleotide-binding protein subunit beta-like protein 1 isoform X1 [Varanus komodoensis]